MVFTDANKLDALMKERTTSTIYLDDEMKQKISDFASSLNLEAIPAQKVMSKDTYDKLIEIGELSKDVAINLIQ